MMNFTSSVSDLESLLLKFKISQDFRNALKVSNMLDIVYSGDRDPHGGHMTTEREVEFLSLYMALHILEDDLEGARYLWKRAPAVLKTDERSELSKLWVVAKLLLTGDEGGGLVQLLSLEREGREASGGGVTRAGVLGQDMMAAMVSRLRDRLYTSILSSYDVVTLPVAAAMLHLSEEDCKEEFLARGCSCDIEQPSLLKIPKTVSGNLTTPGGASSLDDGSLLRTLTECVGQLECQPMSINMKKEVENAQIQVVAEQDEALAMEM